MPFSSMFHRNSFGYVAGLTRFKYTPGNFGTLSGVYSGTTSGAYYTSSGTVQYSTVGVLRESHYINNIQHTLVEGIPATNLFTRSEPTQAQLNNKSAGITAGSLATYGFSVNGSHFPATAQADNAYATTSGVAGSTQYTISVFVVMDDAGAPVPSKSGGTGDFFFVLVSSALTVGTLTTEKIGSGPLYRCSLTFTSAASITTQRGGVGRLVGNSGRGFTVVGFQIEANPFATSYITTTGSTLLRTAELVYIPMTQTPERGTLFLRATAQGGVAIVGGGQVYIGNAGNTGARYFIDADGTGYRINHHNGTSLVSSALATGPARTNPIDLRGPLYGDGSVQAGQVISGGSETLSTTSTSNSPLAGAWSGTRLYIGSTGTTNGSVVALQKIALLKEHPSMTACGVA